MINHFDFVIVETQSIASVRGFVEMQCFASQCVGMVFCWDATHCVCTGIGIVIASLRSNPDNPEKNQQSWIASYLAMTVCIIIVETQCFASPHCNASLPETQRIASLRYHSLPLGNGTIKKKRVNTFLVYTLFFNYKLAIINKLQPSTSRKDLTLWSLG